MSNFILKELLKRRRIEATSKKKIVVLNLTFLAKISS